MFDRIARRYDLLNRLLSFGRDVAWRKAMVRMMACDRPAAGILRLLDVATGTGDVLLAAEKECRLSLGVGLDPSAGMLSVGMDKVRGRGLRERLHLVQGDAQHLAFAPDYFDALTIAFGIRNVADPVAGLREMCRVLKPGGRALVLEFSLPGNPLFRPLYLFYFRHVLPRIGGVISGDAEAYRYLNRTVEAFPYGEAFCAMMREAGFASTKAHPLTLGIATLYCGIKSGVSQ